MPSVQAPAAGADVQIEWLKVLPYLLVLAAALAGIHVMAVLTLGLLAAGMVGMGMGYFSCMDWFRSMGDGMTGMGELIIVTLLAGGVLAMIRFNGGIADSAEATAHLAHVDGAMLGRAGYHTPYLLHELDVAWFGGELRTRGELLRAYRPYVEAQLARGVFLKHIVRHILGLFAGQPGGRAFRQVLSEGGHKPGADWTLVEQALALTERREQAA